MNKPELLSPIQDFVSLRAAMQSGADAVYFGVKVLNMRMGGAKNFEIEDLKKITEITHKNGVRCFLAVNTIVFEDEFKTVAKILREAKRAKVDAIICWDMMVMEEAKKMGFEIHLSTQASVANSRSAEFYRRQGVKRIILARECNLEQIQQIKRKTKIEIETFVHGAMCVAISGRCFMSQFLHGKSANRGECLQPCRREYLIEDIEQRSELAIDSDGGQFAGYVMSPKDLCALPFIEKLIDAGIDCFKIEGRNRSPEYVSMVTKVYRGVIDYYVDQKSETKNKKVSNKAFDTEFEKLKRLGMERLGTVYNRGFSNGFYLGRPINAWSNTHGSLATTKKVHVGKVMHFYSHLNVAEIKIEARVKLKIGDVIMFQGPGTGIHEQIINSMEDGHKKIRQAGQNDLIAVKVDARVRKNDLVYLIRNIKG